MTKYLLNRLIRGLLSVILVVAIVMLLVYSLIDRENIFVSDGTFTKRSNNDRVIYKYQQWEKYGYLDYVPYSDYINSLVASGELTEEDKSTALNIGRTADKDAEMTQQYVQKFTQAYESKGYKIVRLDAVMLKTEGFLSENVLEIHTARLAPCGFVIAEHNIVGHFQLVEVAFCPLHGGAVALVGDIAGYEGEVYAVGSVDFVNAALQGIYGRLVAEVDVGKLDKFERLDFCLCVCGIGRQS